MATIGILLAVLARFLKFHRMSSIISIDVCSFSSCAPVIILYYIASKLFIVSDLCHKQSRPCPQYWGYHRNQNYTVFIDYSNCLKYSNKSWNFIKGIGLDYYWTKILTMFSFI